MHTLLFSATRYQCHNSGIALCRTQVQQVSSSAAKPITCHMIVGSAPIVSWFRHPLLMIERAK